VVKRTVGTDRLILRAEVARSIAGIAGVGRGGFSELFEEVVAEAGDRVVQGVEGAGQVAVRLGDAGEGEDALLEAFDGAPGDVGFVEVGEGLGEEVVLGLDGGAGLGDGFDERGEVLRAEQVGVGAAQAEVGLDEPDFAQGVHFAGAGGLVEEVGEVEEVEQSGKGAFGPRGALGHEGEPAGLPGEAADDDAGVAEGHARDDEALDGARFAHGGGFRIGASGGDGANYRRGFWGGGFRTEGSEGEGKVSHGGHGEHGGFEEGEGFARRTRALG
jgi:hypothetical protein